MQYAGLIYDESFHYLDHLGPFCASLRCPLLVSEPSVADRARHYYPDLEVVEVHLSALPVTTVIACAPRALLHAALNAPTLVTLWLPHGNSDKGQHTPFFEALQPEETAFIYGTQMADTLRKKNVRSKTIRVGNFRWAYYQKHKEFYEKMRLHEGFVRDNTRTTFLYAPTWEDSENNCSFWHAFPLLTANLPDSCHLFVKWHPNTYRQHEAKLERVIGQYAQRKNISFIIDFSPIYPLLEICDAYIGDMSSIGYDFLPFNRPMFFFNPHPTHPDSFLYRCGRCIPLDQMASLFPLHDNTHFSEIQRQAYTYAFDPPVDPTQICAALR